MTDLETAEAHILGREPIQTALCTLLQQDEIAAVKAVLNRHLETTPTPDDEKVAAVWNKAVGLSRWRMEQIEANVDARPWQWFSLWSRTFGMVKGLLYPA